MIESPPPPAAETVAFQPTTVTPQVMPRRYGALAGLVAGAVAVTTGMLVAGIIDVVSPIDAVGSEFIDRVPPWLKELAIQWFGTNDKLALRVGIIVTLAVAAAIVGYLATRRPIAGVVGIGLFGLVGALAALHRPGASASAVLAAADRHGDRHPTARLAPPPDETEQHRHARSIACAARLGSPAVPGVHRIRRRCSDRRRWSGPGARTKADRLDPRGDPRHAAADTCGRQHARSRYRPTRRSARSRRSSRPTATSIGSTLRCRSLGSVSRSWKVDIRGMVDTPLTMTYDDLLARPQVERIVTLCCVSNEVGGEYISNASFQGVMLADLLREAGVRDEAEQVFSTSLDGWTCGFPVAAALDGRDAMIALGMNGEALPLEHGFPARLVVPGLYGYVSATKWLKSIELTTWDAEQGFWVPRGWARDAPIKTQSRIDVPRDGERVAAGTTKIAGIAWAQHRGIGARRSTSRRRTMAASTTGFRRDRRRVASVGARLGCQTGQVHDPGQSNRQERRHPDSRHRPTRSRRGHRIPHPLRKGRLSPERSGGWSRIVPVLGRHGDDSRSIQMYVQVRVVVGQWERARTRPRVARPRRE